MDLWAVMDLNNIPYVGEVMDLNNGMFGLHFYSDKTYHYIYL